MDKSEKTKHYEKKPKAILVMDCVYMETELAAAREAHRLKIRECDELNRRLADAQAKVSCLAHVNGQLTNAVSSLRDGMLIGR